MARRLKIALGLVVAVVSALLVVLLALRPGPIGPLTMPSPPSVVKVHLPSTSRLAFYLGVDKVAWGPKPGQMVTATYRGHGFLTLWDLFTGRMLAQRRLNSCPMDVLVEPRTGRVLVICFGWGSKEIRFEAWAPDLSRRLWRWTLRQKHKPGKPPKFSLPLGMLIHPSGKFAIVEYREEGKLLACDTRTGKMLKAFVTGMGVWALFFDRTGTKMAVSFLGRPELQVWDLLTGKRVGQVRAPFPMIDNGAFCSDGGKFVGFNWLRKRFAAFDLKTERVLFERNCEHVAVSPDGTYALLLPSFELWDLGKLAPVERVKFGLSASKIKAIWLAPGASNTLVIDDEGRWRLFDLRARREISSSPPSAPVASALSFVAPGRLLVAIEKFQGRQVALALWDAANVLPVSAREIPVESLVFRTIAKFRGERLSRLVFNREIPTSPNGELIAVPLYEMVDVYRTKPCLERIASIKRKTPSAPFPNGGCILQKRKLVVVHEGEYPNTYLAAYDLESGRLKWTCSVNVFSVPHVTSDERLMLVATLDGVYTLDPATGSVTGTIGPMKPASGLSLSRAGLVALMVVERRGKPKVVVYDLKTGAEVLRLDRGDRPTLSPNGRYLAVSFTGGAVEVYDVKSGRLLGSIPLSPHWIWPPVAFDPGGRTLAVASYFGNEVGLFDLPSLALRARIYLLPENRWAVLKPDGTLIFPRGAGGHLRITTPDGRAKALSASKKKK